MVKVVFDRSFLEVYTSDPAAEANRMESILEVIEPHVEMARAKPASEGDIAMAHSSEHIAWVKSLGLHPIASLAAGAAIRAAELGLASPAFGLIRPPGHHASQGSAWGFCYYNNMAVALTHLKKAGKINTAFVLDIDLHYGDGTENILGGRGWAEVYNVEAREREGYLPEVEKALAGCDADLIGISAGFDMHEKDWGGRLKTEDYFHIGRLARAAADASGGYNHQVLGENALALIQGMGGSEGMQ